VKSALTIVGVILALMSAAATAAEDTKSTSIKADAEDCSKQVWPHFSPSCIRNADKAVAVRLVTPDRR